MKLVDVTLGKLLSTKRTVPWNIAIFQILTVTRLIRILTEVPQYNSRPEPYASWVHHGRTTSGGESPGEPQGGPKLARSNAMMQHSELCTTMDSTLSQDILCLLYHLVIRGFPSTAHGHMLQLYIYIGLCYKGKHEYDLFFMYL